MKKSVHWFFHSYALVDQDIPLCSMITPTAPDQCRMEVRKGKREHGAYSSSPGSRCSWGFFSHKSLDAWRLQLQAAAFIHTFRTALHDTKAATQMQSRKGTHSSCSFCAFSQQLGQLRQHPHKLFSIFRSPPVGLRKPHSYSNERSYNAMTVNA